MYARMSWKLFHGPPSGSWHLQNMLCLSVLLACALKMLVQGIIRNGMNSALGYFVDWRLRWIASNKHQTRLFSLKPCHDVEARVGS